MFDMPAGVVFVVALVVMGIGVVLGYMLGYARGIGDEQERRR